MRTLLRSLGSVALCVAFAAPTLAQCPVPNSGDGFTFIVYRDTTNPANYFGTITNPNAIDSGVSIGYRIITKDACEGGPVTCSGVVVSGQAGARGSLVEDCSMTFLEGGETDWFTITPSHAAGTGACNPRVRISYIIPGGQTSLAPQVELFSTNDTDHPIFIPRDNCR